MLATKGIVMSEPEHINLIVGRRIKELRRQRGFTLENISKLAGLSTSLLSQIEKGNINVSIANLLKISRALEVEIEYFVHQHDRHEEFEIVRAEERQSVPDHALPDFLGYSYRHFASFTAEGTVELFTVELEPLAEHEMKPNTHPGIELVFVLDGHVEFRAEHGYQVRLHPGDSLRFPAKYQHAYRAIEGGARVIAICYSSIGQRLRDISKLPGEYP
jgi:transcriptional regulator with XRE-family HTH domain